MDGKWIQAFLKAREASASAHSPLNTRLPTPLLGTKGIPAEATSNRRRRPTSRSSYAVACRLVRWSSLLPARGAVGKPA